MLLWGRHPEGDVTRAEAVKEEERITESKEKETTSLPATGEVFLAQTSTWTLGIGLGVISSSGVQFFVAAVGSRRLSFMIYLPEPGPPVP